MPPDYPILFTPHFKERVWGGRRLETLYRKPLPPGTTIGESWEIVDRADAISVIANGPLVGKSLRWLMQQFPRELLGPLPELPRRFPLLVKILDAQHKLSLQVHPPASVARLLKGEPKTEFWYVTAAEPGAELYAGLRQGVTREIFEREIERGAVEHCFHRIPVQAGSAMFLPSGRVHAIGAGIVLFEVQQNSDTTYRVHDWNRLGLDGKPRALHLTESLQSIDFLDFEPRLTTPEEHPCQSGSMRTLLRHPLFHLDLLSFHPGARAAAARSQYFEIYGIVSGELGLQAGNTSVRLSAGDFALIPACLKEMTYQAEGPVKILRVRPGTD